MKRIMFLAGFAIGYVLGSKAGRQRYEQIRSAAARLSETDAARSVAESVSRAAGNARDRAAEAMHLNRRRTIDISDTREPAFGGLH